MNKTNELSILPANVREAVEQFDCVTMHGDKWAVVRAELLRLAARHVPNALTYEAFRAANVARCLKWHPKGISSWSSSDWLTAIMGELGELASLIKMRNRERDGLPGNKFSPTDKQIADEIADVLTYLDLFAEVLGVNLGRVAVEKFNEVSERVGFPDRIVLGAAQTVAQTASISTPLRIDLAEEQVRELFAFLAAGEGDFVPCTLLIGDGHSGNGLYAAQTEYSDEGATFIAPIWNLPPSFIARATSDPHDEPPVIGGAVAPIPMPEPVAQTTHHPDDVAVDLFAAAMKAKLEYSRNKHGRGGWNDKSDCSAEHLSDLLRGHVTKGDPVDVANFACFLWNRQERIVPQVVQTDVPDGVRSICREFIKAARIVQQIAAMGHDSTDKEIADEAIRIARLWRADDAHDDPLSEAIRMLAASPAPTKTDEWQPIETAPKDRTILLGYFNAHGKWRTLRGRWVTQDEIDHEWEDGDMCAEGWYETAVEPDEMNCWPTKPTHWTKLPAPLAVPPAQSQKEQECNINCDCVGECKAQAK